MGELESTDHRLQQIKIIDGKKTKKDPERVLFYCIIIIKIMDEDFLFYCMFKDEMSGEFERTFEKRINLIYKHTEEVSGNGSIINRAVKRGEPEELIATHDRIFKLGMN